MQAKKKVCPTCGEEKWLDIPNYEGLYCVSDIGGIRSYDRTVKCKYGSRVVKGKILKPSKDNNGYLLISLTKNGRAKYFRVHQLVAMEFLKHIPDGTNRKVVNHINHKRDDNRLSNLEVVTNRVNSIKKAPNKTNGLLTGVYLFKDKFKSSIAINGDNIDLGSFDSEIEAHRCYLKALNNINKYEGCRNSFMDFLKLKRKPTPKYEGIFLDNGKFRVIVYLSGKRSERKYVGYIEHLKDAVDLRNDFIKRNNLLEFNKINIYDGEKMHV